MGAAIGNCTAPLASLAIAPGGKPRPTIPVESVHRNPWGLVLITPLPATPTTTAPSAFTAVALELELLIETTPVDEVHRNGLLAVPLLRKLLLPTMTDPSAFTPRAVLESLPGKNPMPMRPVEVFQRNACESPLIAPVGLMSPTTTKPSALTPATPRKLYPDGGLIVSNA
jgi:hypothetical protein